jgi:hypothetical protein
MYMVVVKILLLKGCWNAIKIVVEMLSKLCRNDTKIVLKCCQSITETFLKYINILMQNLKFNSFLNICK